MIYSKKLILFNPLFQIKEIICCYTNTNIKPGDDNKLRNLAPGIKITLIDIDSMAHDICENYTHLSWLVFIYFN